LADRPDRKPHHLNFELDTSMNNRHQLVNEDDDEIVINESLFICSNNTQGDFKWSDEEHEYIEADPFGDPIEILMRREAYMEDA
jgi:hypothetical protein